MNKTDSKYYMGVDFASDDDYSAYTVVRAIRWYEKLWCWIRRKPQYRWKVIDSWTQKEPKPKKYRTKR